MINKKTIIGMMTVCSACLFVSCSDDDSNGSSAPKAPVTTFSGKLLAQAGNFKYMYDEYGRCYHIDGGYEEGKYIIDYDKGIIKIESENEEARISFNGKGYITALAATWNYTDEYGSSKGSGKVTFSYDGDGHLTAEESSYNGTDIEDGEEEHHNSTYKSVHTWKNGNLTNTVSTFKENDKHGIETEEDKYTVEYGNVKNVTEQVTFAISNALDHDTYEPLAMIGMLGKGTAYLPTAVIIEDGESWHQPTRRTVNASYSLNSDGTVKSENYNGNKSYTYVTIDAGSDKEKAPIIKAPWQNNDKKLRMKDFFVRNRNRK